jgi:hypothetical protein
MKAQMAANRPIFRYGQQREAFKIYPPPRRCFLEKAAPLRRERVASRRLRVPLRFKQLGQPLWVSQAPLEGSRLSRAANYLYLARNLHTNYYTNAGDILVYSAVPTGSIEDQNRLLIGITGTCEYSVH